MPHPPRLFPGDVELGKRDDDHKPGSMRPLSTAAAWSFHRIWLRRSYKKIVLGLVLVIGLYYFFNSMATELSPRTVRSSYDHPTAVQGPNRLQKPKPATYEESVGSTPSETAESDSPGAEIRHTFNGPIKFYELASSLRAVAKQIKFENLRTGHVLFAASSVKSAASLLPLACEMATFERSYIHFTFMGRDEISIELLKELNGVKVGCDISFHDGRPDYVLQSSDYRMEVSSSAALGHIDTFMHPAVVIVDNSGAENLWFMKAMRDRTSFLGKTLIELTSDVEQGLRWITRLDSFSLKFWNKVSIDIVVHAQPGASGSLLRLLGSLSRADYSKSAPPRLTIELPHEVDEPTRKFLEDFKWPPSDHLLQGSLNQLNLRHRILEPSFTIEESSIRFLESFWPANPAISHLLVLSPQVELSPLYFQYLKYFILEYRYSKYWVRENSLMGISLDLPSTYLNDSTAFLPSRAGNPSSNSDTALTFLWQAPNSNAILYFGNMWTELHSFVSKSLVSQNRLPAPTTLNAKEVSKTYPSWLESILKLARTRGYYFLYSTLADEAAIAITHNELFQPPEEFIDSSEAKDYSSSEVPAEFSADSTQNLSLEHVEKPLASKSLLSVLSSDGILPNITDMQLLSWDGKAVTKLSLEEAASKYSQVFRREAGGCSTSNTHKTMVKGSAEDLFCLDDSSGA